MIRYPLLERFSPPRFLHAACVGAVLAALLLPLAARSQCTGAAQGSITIYMFDFKSQDIPQDRLHKILDMLTFKLNNAIREDLSSRGLLGGTPFAVRWCSGKDVSAHESAVSSGKQLNSAGVFWGFIDQSAGQMKSVLKLTALVDNPITDLRNIVYRNESRESVDASYLAFAAYIVGKTHLSRGNVQLSRKCFKYARDLRALPDLLQRDCGIALAQLDQQNPARKLTPVGR
ncbi:MAG: hypothetical protein IPP94_09560 [Ignavibacteria bacterium]|nr:hypothetical protein [Ignavibacteria bacterium]